MKQLNIYPIGFMLIGLLFVTSCNDQTKEINRLKHQNELLTKLIAKFVKENKKQNTDLTNNAAPNGMELIEMPLDNFKTGIAEVSKDKSIMIPTSWQFESAELLDMITHTDESGVMAEGIMGFAIEENGKLKIGMIPYYVPSGTTDTKLIEQPYKAYNYSHMCPTECSVNLQFLGATNSGYQFTNCQ
jgi:hypothetical protein